jgi:hypothetical protein
MIDQIESILPDPIVASFQATEDRGMKMTLAGLGTGHCGEHLITLTPVRKYQYE